MSDPYAISDPYSSYDPYAASDPYTTTYRRYPRRTRPRHTEPVERPATGPIRGYSAPDDDERMTALEWLVDRLSMFQYASANLDEDVLKFLRTGDWESSFDQPLRKGFSGERRGDYEDVLFGGPSTVQGRRDQPGLFPIEDEPGGGRQAARAIGGFIGNVIFDPSTYIGLGSTAAGRVGAKGVATLAVQQARRQLADPAVARAVFGDRVARATTAAKRTKAIGDAPLQQYLNRVYKDAYREALVTPSEQLRNRYLRSLDFEKKSNNSLLKRQGLDKDVRKELLERSKSIDDELKKVGNRDWWERGIPVDQRTAPGDSLWTGFGHTGEQAARVGQFIGFGGKELFTGMAGPVRRKVAEVGAALRRAGREAPGTKQFLDAWWRSRTHGVMGQITKAIGFPRTAYQQALRQIELSQESFSQDIVRRNIERVEEAFSGVSEETERAYVTFLSAVYDQAGRAVAGVRDPDAKRRLLEVATRKAWQDPMVWSRIPAEQKQPVTDLYAKLDPITKEWHAEESQIAAAGIIKGAGYVRTYLPIQWRPVAGETPATARKRGSMVFSPLLKRNISYSEARSLEARKMAGFFGLDEDSALALIDENAGALISDPKALLIGRAIANGRMRGRANMLMQMRSFGLDVNAVNFSRSMISERIPHQQPLGEGGRTFQTAGGDDVRRALVHAYQNGHLQDIGLHTIPGEKFLEGWVFDKSVRDMLERTVDITADELHPIGNALRGYTRWVQGILTLRPGYHVRNILSNQVMVALRQGGRAFNPRYLMEGAAGAAHELSRQGSKIVQAADSVLAKTRIKRALLHQHGGYSIAELASVARQKGVISRVSLSGDPADLSPKVRSKANPLRWQQAAFGASQNVGALAESTQRFGFMLMELDKMARPGLRFTEAQLEHAAFEARKWMVDYQNLTDFEKKYMRMLRPFYAWWRHAAAMMAEGIIDAPHLYSSAFKGEQKLEDVLAGDIEFDLSDVPDWVREQGGITMGMGEDGKVIMGNLGLPWSEFNQFAVSFPSPGGEPGLPRLSGQTLMRELIGASHPLLKTAVESATGKGLFFGQNLEGYRRVPRGLRAVEAVPVPVLQFLDGVSRMWSPRGLGFTREDGTVREDRRGRLMMNARMAQAIENNLPVVTWIARVLDGPVAGMEAAGLRVEEALDNAKLGRDDHDNLDEFLKLLSFYAGVSAWQVDVRARRPYRPQYRDETGPEYVR